MREGRSNDETSQGVAHEADARETADGAEGLDVLFDLVGQALSHFKNVPLRQLLIGTRLQEEGLGVLQRQVVLEQTHVPRVALEAVAQHEQVHADDVSGLHFFVHGYHLLLGEHLRCVFDELGKVLVDVLHVAFLEDYRVQVCALPEYRLVLHLHHHVRLHVVLFLHYQVRASSAGVLNQIRVPLCLG